MLTTFKVAITLGNRKDTLNAVRASSKLEALQYAVRDMFGETATYTEGFPTKNPETTYTSSFGTVLFEGKTYSVDVFVSENSEKSFGSSGY